MRPSGTDRPRVRHLLRAVAALLVLSGCGLPGEGPAQTVADRDVPYALLDTDPPLDVDGTDASPAPSRVPVVFWLRGDDRLAASAVTASCTDPDVDVVRQVLATLALSPSSTERTDGLSSAIPPTAELELVDIEDGVAQVALDPVTSGDAERLPFAVGQLVLSVTSAPGVDGVSLVTSGRGVDVPLPGGELATRAVSADDYAALLPDGLTTGRGAVVRVSADIGCP